MRSGTKGMVKLKRFKGFTLVELIAVVAIISMIAVYITIEINRSSDDAKIGIATAFLTSNVPSAISSYRARHLGSCKDIDGDAGANETLPDAVGDDSPSNTKFRLMDRGLAAETPWDDFWTAEWVPADRQIKIVFPIPGANAASIADDLLANLQGKSQVVSATSDADGLTVVYSCS